MMAWREGLGDAKKVDELLRFADGLLCFADSERQKPMVARLAEHGCGR
jgi:hypothetical protein